MWHFLDSSFNMDLEFLKLEIHIKTRVLKTRFASVIDLESLRLEFYAKKISPIVAFLSLTVTF